MFNPDNIRVVLVNPIYGGNVGAICRAMANNAMSDLALVAPQNLDMVEAIKMACAGRPVLEAKREFPNLAAAVADCSMVVGTTARLGLYRSHSRSPRDAAPMILDAAQAGKVALVFGPEDNGLSNEDLALCTHIIQIPSSPACSSLNLAQAVLICCYEIYVAGGTFEPSKEKSPEAPSEVRERMFELWRQTLLEIGFMKEDKADHMMLGLRRVLSRGKLSIDDTKIMMGIAKQAAWAARRENTAGSGPSQNAGQVSDR